MQAVDCGVLALYMLWLRILLEYLLLLSLCIDGLLAYLHPGYFRSSATLSRSLRPPRVGPSLCWMPPVSLIELLLCSVLGGP